MCLMTPEEKVLDELRKIVRNYTQFLKVTLTKKGPEKKEKSKLLLCA